MYFFGGFMESVSVEFQRFESMVSDVLQDHRESGLKEKIRSMVHKQLHSPESETDSSAILRIKDILRSVKPESAKKILDATKFLFEQRTTSPLKTSEAVVQAVLSGLKSNTSFDKGWIHLRSNPKKEVYVEDLIAMLKKLPDFEHMRSFSNKSFLKEIAKSIFPEGVSIPPTPEHEALAKFFDGLVRSDDFQKTVTSFTDRLRHIQPSFSLRFDSVTDLLSDKNAKEVMVYGFEHAHYGKVHDALLSVFSPMNTVLDWKEHEWGTTEMKKISEQGKPEKAGKGTNRVNKGTLVDLAFENLVRKRRGLPLIPLIFCMHSNTAPDSFAPTASSICSEGRFTNKELRRLYRMIVLFAESPLPELREIASVAKEMIHMARVDIQRDGSFRLVSTDFPWGDPSWKKAWEKRELEARNTRGAVAEEEKQTSWWRKSLVEEIQRL